MTRLSDLIPIPPLETFNLGLHSASESTMIRLLGVPGQKTDDCSNPTGDFNRHIVENVDVGPFRVSGLNLAVESVKQVFAELKRQAPQVHDEVSTQGLGMLCVRHRRRNRDVFSNHSWGTAIDLKFGLHEVDQGEHLTQRGFLSLFPIFNQFGWYWGAGFSNGSVDSMHFELAEETIARLIVGGLHERITDGPGGTGPGTGRLADDPDLADVATGRRILVRRPSQQRGVGAVQDALIALGARINLGAAGASRGIFGPQTQAAVKDFQRNAGIDVDGLVGQDTIGALDRALAQGQQPGLQRAGQSEIPGSLDEIIRIGADSVIARHIWVDRGVAPFGYTKGMALVFARTLCKLKAGDPFALEMAKADTGDDDRDAVTHCREQFTDAGMDNAVSGPDTLRHLFVLLMGLGMRESSGKYCEGRDTSEHNTDAESAEAGLFQTSFNARRASVLLPRLFEQASANRAGFLDIFKEGVRCRASDLENFGDGPGRDFQQLSKESPAFAAEFAAITLRNNRQHYGPINRREAEVLPACDAMFKEVQQTVERSSLCPFLV
jgi:hypothetical protein